MTKQKVGVITASIFGALVLIGGGFWLGRGHLFGGASQNLNAAATDYGSSSSGSNSQLLNPSPGGSSGLSVSNGSTAGSLGQLGASSGQNPAGGSSAGNSTASSSSSPVDPATFAQYDKYKNENQALFGDVQAGNGTALTSGKQASVYYKGWLTSGTLFDESRAGANGQLQPFTFTLGAHQVIAGWEEGLSGMKVGGTRLIVVPPSVGYGAQGQGSIPPNSVLVFEVQLLSVQ